MMRPGPRKIAVLLSLLAAWAAAPPAASDYQSAVEAFQAGRFDEACVEFGELVEQTPTYDFGHFVVGQCAAAGGRHDEALLHFRTAVELNPDRADFRCKLAGEQLRAGRHDEALAALDGALGGVGDHLRYSFHSTRGLALAALERWDEALPDLRAADQERPAQWPVIDRIGLSLFGLQRHDEAVPFLRRSLEMKPERPSGQRLLAEALLRGDPGEARAEIYEEALRAARAYREANPDDPAAENLVGRAALGAGEHQQAVDALTRFLSSKPGHCPARVNLALGQLGLRRWEAAERELKAADECSPDSVVVLDRLALVYRLQQRLEESLETYERLRQFHPSPEVEQSIREVRYNLEAQAMNRAADEREEEIRIEKERVEREAAILQDKIDRYVRAVSD